MKKRIVVMRDDMMMISKVLDNCKCLRCSDGHLGTNGRRSYIEVSSVSKQSRRGGRVSSEPSSSISVACISCKKRVQKRHTDGCWSC